MAKFDTRSYMKEILELDEKYINDICSYYKNSLIYYMLQSDLNDISDYRKQLIDIYSDKDIIFDESGYKYNEDQYVDSENQIGAVAKAFDRHNLSGTIIFSIIQYEEDTRIEKYDEMYDYSKFDYSLFRKELYDEINKNTQCQDGINHIIKDGKIQRKRKNKSYIILNNKELLYDYWHKGNKIYICLSEWNGQFMATKFKISIDSPFSEKSLEYFENNNSVKITNTGKITKTINNSSVLVFSEREWMIM